MKNVTKTVNDTLPIQFLHLRFVDTFLQDGVESNESVVRNRGGYTLAYRCIKHVEGAVFSVELEYAFSECNEEDNYERARGRSIASARLNWNAPKLSFCFTLDDLPGDVNENQLLILQRKVDTYHSIVDINEAHYDLRATVVNHFLSDTSYLLGTAIDINILDARPYLTTYRGALALDSSVLGKSVYSLEQEIFSLSEGVIANTECFIYESPGDEEMDPRLKEYLRKQYELGLALVEAAGEFVEDDGVGRVTFDALYAKRGIAHVDKG
jgi:hypothetical protein